MVFEAFLFLYFMLLKVLKFVWILANETIKIDVYFFYVSPGGPLLFLDMSMEGPQRKIAGNHCTVLSKQRQNPKQTLKK